MSSVVWSDSWMLYQNMGILSKEEIRKSMEEKTIPETDDELRIRVLYVAGNDNEIFEARGEKLDEIATRFSLRRRK